MKAHGLPRTGPDSQSQSDPPSDAGAGGRAARAALAHPGLVDQLVEVIGSLVVVLDSAGNIVRFNRACQELTGWGEGELLGRELREVLVAPEGREAAKALCTQLQQGLVSSGTLETDWVLRGGGRRRVLLHATALRAPAGGALSFVVATGHDVTAQREQEEALRRSEQRYALASRASGTLVYDWDVRTGRIAWEPGTLVHLRLTYEDLGESADAYGTRIHPEDAPRVAEVVHAAITRSEPLVATYRFRRGDGTWATVLDRGLPVTDADGHTARMVGSVEDITARLEAQEARRVSEERLRVAVEAAQLGTWHWDLVNGRVEWDARTLAIFGVPPEEFTGSMFHYVDALHPEDRPLLDAAVAGVREGRQRDYRLEHRIRLPGGEERWLECWGTAVLEGEPGDAPGGRDPPASGAAEAAAPRVTGITGVLRDITEDRHQREALEESRRLVEQLARTVPGHLYLLDLQSGRTVFQNEGLPRFLGPGPQGSSERESSWAGWVHPEDLARLAEARMKAATAPEGEVVEVEYRVRDAAGAWRWLHAWETGFGPGEGGGPRQVLGIAQDVTRLKQADLDALLRTLAQNLPGALFEATFYDDGTARISVASEPFEQLVGALSRTRVPLEDMLLRMHPEDREEVRARFLAGMAQGGAFVLEMRLKARSGAPWRWLSFHLNPRRTAAGHVTVYGYVTDVTDKRAMAQRLADTERRARLELAEANARLQGANRELEAFAYSVSHDLRAPLRHIDGFGLALEEDCLQALPEQGRAYVKQIRASTRRMGQLIEGLLNLSRVSRVELNLAPVDLSAMAAEIATELSQADPGRRVEWRVAPGLTARGDRALLRTALTNLLENAWKYTGKTEHPRVELGLAEVDGAPWAYVRDNGAGFDMAYAHNLFGPFRRLHTAAEFPGNGIGLASVQRILQRHGGAIRAESQVGQGATFWFRLPGLGEPPPGAGAEGPAGPAGAAQGAAVDGGGGAPAGAGAPGGASMGGPADDAGADAGARGSA